MVFGCGGRGLRNVDIHDLPLRLADSAVGYDARRSAGLAATRAYSLYVRTQLRSASAQSALHSGTGHDFRHTPRNTESRQSNPYISAVAGGGRLHSCRCDAMVDSAGGMAGADGSERRGTAGTVGSRAVYRRAGHNADCLAVGYSTIAPHAPPQSRALDAGDASHGIFLLRSDSGAGRHSLAGQRLAARQSLLVRGVSGPRAVRQQTAPIRSHALQQGDV